MVSNPYFLKKRKWVIFEMELDTGGFGGFGEKKQTNSLTALWRWLLMGTIKICISGEGNISIEAKEGFEGKSCQEAIDHYEQPANWLLLLKH